jgi:hypothetical protein
LTAAMSRPTLKLVTMNDKPRKNALSDLDADFIRVLEDLIDALINNGTLRLTDLPPQALDKLQKRKQARLKLRDSLDLLEDDDEHLL